MSDNKQIPSTYKEWRKFINKNWDLIIEIYEKGLTEYFDSINLLNIECLKCQKYGIQTCSGWNWRENSFTHKCINFIDINNKIEE